MTTPDGQGLPQPRTSPPPFGQSAVGNLGPTVQVGGSNTGNINITGRPKLPVIAIARGDREAALEPLWAHTPTPQQAANLLAAHGLAVILGERGTGRHISAVRALHTHLSTPAGVPRLYDLAADWEDDEVPEREVLPEPIAGHGYLIDAASRLISENAARALMTWAEELHAVGSCLVITGSQRDWRGDNRFEIGAVRPDAVQVARNHLAHAGSHAQAGWLQTDVQRAATRGLLRQAVPDRTVGILSDLITRTVSPGDAVAIAGRLRAIDPGRLARAAEHRDSPPESPEYQQGARELRRIREEVLLWTNFLEETLAGTGTRGQDRMMLLAAAYLEGAPSSCASRQPPRSAPAMKHSHAATGKAAAPGAGWLTSVSTRPTTLLPSTAAPDSPSPPSVRTGTTGPMNEGKPGSGSPVSRPLMASPKTGPNRSDPGCWTCPSQRWNPLLHHPRHLDHHLPRRTTPSHRHRTHHPSRGDRRTRTSRSQTTAGLGDKGPPPSPNGRRSGMQRPLRDAMAAHGVRPATPHPGRRRRSSPHRRQRSEHTRGREYRRVATSRRNG